MVLDGVEERTRERMRKETVEGRLDEGTLRHSQRPSWDKDEEWGNDGLVTVQSAKWGEFLGVMEGCDHWEMRGARGIAPELPHLSKVSLGLPLGKVDLSLNLGVSDWGKFVGAWKREDSRTRRAGATTSSAGGGGEEEERKRERDQDEADIKSSTDRVSAVLDWLVEQVPSPPKLKLGEEKGAATEEKRKEKRNELGTKEGLERFYIALSRKLWDEGL
jgi:triacylglycerol lipase